MDRQREREAIEQKLQACQRLAGEFGDGPTARHLKELTTEFRAELEALDETRER
mgnify:CR=1 FL=1